MLADPSGFGRDVALSECRCTTEEGCFLGTWKNSAGNVQFSLHPTQSQLIPTARLKQTCMYSVQLVKI